MKFLITMTVVRLINAGGMHNGGGCDGDDDYDDDDILQVTLSVCSKKHLTPSQPWRFYQGPRNVEVSQRFIVVP